MMKSLNIIEKIRVLDDVKTTWQHYSDIYCLYYGYGLNFIVELLFGGLTNSKL